MAKRDEFRLDLTANDQASKTVDALAEKVEGLNASAQVEITAEDDASEVIEDVTEEVDELDGASAEATLEAEDEASEIVDEVTDKVGELDEAEALATLEAEDLASDDIESVVGEVAALDGDSAAVTLEAEDNATDVIDEVVASAEAVDDTFTATIETEGATEAQESTGGIADNLGSIVGGKGLAALSAAGMLAIGQSAADAVLEVAGLAEATGGTLEQTSRVKEAWELAGGSVDTLERNVIRANDRLRESPELASQLGIQITDNMSPLDVFIAAVERLNSGQLTANERLTLATEIFGARGVLMLNDLDTRVGDLGDAMAEVGENEIITQDQVDSAIKLSQNWDTIEDTVGAIGRQIMPVVATHVENIAGLLESWPVQQLLNDFQVLNTEISIMDGLLLNLDPGSLAESPAAMQIMIDRLNDATSDFQLAGEAWDGFMGRAEPANEALAENAEATANAAAAVEEHIDALNEQADALEDTAEALVEQGDAYEELADANDDYAEKQRDLTEAQDDYNAAVRDGTPEEQADALRDVVGAADDLADAAVEAARQTARLNGETLSSVDALDHQNSSMLASAAAMNGEARQAILQRIYDINQIPPSVQTQIEAAIADGDLEEADRLLDGASKPRQVYMSAEMVQNKADLVRRQANALAAARNVPITPQLTGTKSYRDALNSLTQPRYQSIIAQLQTRRRAQGDPFTSEGAFLVGEQGPELVALPTGSSIATAGQTETMRNGDGNAGGTTVNHITNNFPAGTTSWDVLKSQRRYARTQAA